MTRRAGWSLALCALACLIGHGHARAQCTHATFGKEILAHGAGDTCPKSNEPELEALIRNIDAAIDNNALDKMQKSAALLAELRKLRDAYGQRPTWGASLTLGIDAAILRARTGEMPLSSFANVRFPVDGVDPPECAAVIGTAGELGYTCIVLEGSPLPQGAAARIYALAPYEAAVAARALSAAHSAISKLNIPELDEAIDRLTKAQKRFDNLRQYGYLQYPWELGLDTALTPRARYDECQTTDTFCSSSAGLDPASLRVIFLHPGVGIAAPGLGFKGQPSWDTAIALSLEAIGFVSYTESFETYWGLSGGAIVSDGDFGDMRFGLFVHATRWLHAGYLLSVLREATRGDASVFVSVDLGTTFGASFLE